MPIETDPPFLFANELPATIAVDARIVRIPAGIKTKMGLLAVLAHGLGFPDYFGWNWDALDECLRDLSWMPSPHQIVLFHEGWPLAAESDDRSIYLDILRDAVTGWSPAHSHELVVIFPRGTDNVF